MECDQICGNNSTVIVNLDDPDTVSSSSAAIAVVASEIVAVRGGAEDGQVHALRNRHV